LRLLLGQLELMLVLLHKLGLLQKQNLLKFLLMLVQSIGMISFSPQRVRVQGA
jgi:hypothetical protein